MLRTGGGEGEGDEDADCAKAFDSVGAFADGLVPRTTGDGSGRTRGCLRTANDSFLRAVRYVFSCGVSARAIILP